MTSQPKQFESSGVSVRGSSHTVAGVATDTQLSVGDSWRTYVGRTTSKGHLGGVPVSNSVVTKYYIRPNTVNKTFDPPVGHGSYRATFNVEAKSSEQMVTLAKKFTNFSGSFTVADFSAIICDLAMMIAHYGNTGTLVFNDLLGDRVPDLVSLGSAVVPVTASQNTVFVPRLVDNAAAPGTLAAFVLACTRTGSTLATDMVRVDETGRATYPTANGVQLALGALNALRHLGGVMESSGASTYFTLALVQGVHRMCTLSGHSEEGSWFRNALRAGGYAPSFGAVNLALSFQGLEEPSANQVGFCNLVDKIVLATGGLLACCDPFVYFPTADKWMPTVSYIERGLTGAARGHAHFANISNTLGVVTEKYVVRAATLLSFSDSAGGAEGCSTLFMTMMTEHDWGNDAHFNGLAVAPYYWVEPRHVVPLPASAMPFTNNDNLLAPPNVPFKIGMFESKVLDIVNGGPGYMARVEYSTARRSGAFTLLSGRREDGLALMIPRQADAYGWMLTRVGDREDIRDKIDAGDGMDQYLWVRGDTGDLHPAEAAYLSKEVSFLVILLDASDNMFTSRSIFEAEELNNDVVVLCSSVTGVANGGNPGGSRSDKSERAKYGRTVTQLAGAARRGFREVVTMMHASYNAPGFNALVARKDAGTLGAGIFQMEGEGDVDSGQGKPVPITQLAGHKTHDPTTRALAGRGGGGPQAREAGGERRDPAPDRAGGIERLTQGADAPPVANNSAEGLAGAGPGQASQAAVNAALERAATPAPGIKRATAGLKSVSNTLARGAEVATLETGGGESASGATVPVEGSGVVAAPQVAIEPGNRGGAASSSRSSQSGEGGIDSASLLSAARDLDNILAAIPPEASPNLRQSIALARTTLVAAGAGRAAVAAGNTPLTLDEMSDVIRALDMSEQPPSPQ